MPPEPPRLPPFEELGRGTVLLRGPFLEWVMRHVERSIGDSPIPEVIRPYVDGLRRQRLEAAAAVDVPVVVLAPVLDASDLVDVDEVARLLGCSVRTVRRKAERFGGVMVGGKWVFEREVVSAATRVS